MSIGVDPNSPTRSREDASAPTEARLRQAATERRLASVQPQFGGTTHAQAQGMDVKSNREAVALDAAADAVRWDDLYGDVPDNQLGDAEPPVSVRELLGLHAWAAPKSNMARQASITSWDRPS